MNKHFVKLMILSIIFFIGILCNIHEVECKESINILFISAYNPNFITFNDQINGIKKEFGNNLMLQIEYMDSKTFSEKENEKNFYNLLKYKINNYKDFDAIILADDEALEFGMKYRNELFKNIPMVFLAVEKQENIDKALKLDMVSGVSEVESLYDNIELIIKMQPNIKNINIINEDKQQIKEKVYEYINSKYKNVNLNYIFTKDLSSEKLKEKLRKMDKNDVIFSIYPNHTKDNKIMDTNEIINFVGATTNVPIYHAVDLKGQEESIGGKVTSHFDQGMYAAKIVKKMLNGEDAKDLFIDGNTINKYKFNYRKIKQYRINQELIPKDSIVVNKPITFFKKHAMIILPLVIIITSLIIIIIMFAIYEINRNNYERQLVRAKEVAEAANKAKGNFISNINHELRTPVTVIMSANQLLNFKISKLKCLKKEDFIDKSNTINQNCYRLIRLINNIIDLTQVDSGVDELSLKEVNIIELLEGIVTSVTPYTKSKGIDLVFDTMQEEVIMEVDTDKIERILLNLLSNAIKFSRDNGKINVNVMVEEERLIFDVKDNGIGIEKKYLEEIFVKFTQVDNTLKRNNEGSGIGLAVVKSFVNMHKGKIYVKSELGLGSDFIVELPIKRIEKEDKVKDYTKNNKSTVLNTNIELSDIYL